MLQVRAVSRTQGGVRKTHAFEVDAEVDGERRTWSVIATCGIHARRIVIAAARKRQASMVIIHSHTFKETKS